MYSAHAGRPAGPPRALTLIALIVAVVASVLGPVATASAAAAPTPTAPAPSKAAPETAAPKATAAQARALAARQIAEGGLADTCSGPIAPNTVHTCSAWPAESSTTSFTLDVPRAEDLVVARVVGAHSSSLNVVLTAPDGSEVACDLPDGSGSLRCPTSQAGPHTLRLTDTWGGGSGFSVSYRALLSDTACTAVTDGDTALGRPAARALSLAAGSTGDCLTLPTGSGEVLRLFGTDYRVSHTVYDAAGAQICSTRVSGYQYVDCTLTGTAPYRLLATERDGAASELTLTTARLSHPSGCPVVQPQAYGAVPDATGTARCHTLRVPADGPYLFGTVDGKDGNGASLAGRLYRGDGTPVCSPEPTTPCRLTAGDYTWSRDAVTGAVTDAYGVWFLATAQAQGCTPVKDDGFASGPATGTFTDAGQALCLGLPTASGRGLYLLDRASGEGAAHPTVRVYDAKGEAQCANEGAPGVCKLTGTAPFHAVLSATAPGAYALAVHRTGEAAGCTPWAPSGFGNTWGAQTALAAGQTACLSLAGDAHSTAEMVDYTNDSNQVNAWLRVHDAAGNQVCGTTVSTSTTTCRLSAGAPYTALLTKNGYGSDTYKLVRRDISETARCAAPKSLAVGGPSTPYTLRGDLDATCLRVTAAAADKLWLSVRTPDAAYKTGAVLGVVDGSGTIKCRTWGTAGTCRVTGSTSYLVYVVAVGYGETPIASYVDTWRVGTASGWAPECTANKVSAAGFAQRSAVLTESATAYCAVLDMKPRTYFDVDGVDSEPNGASPTVSLLAANAFGPTTDYSYQCNGTGFRHNCLADGNAPTGQYVLLVTPGKAPTPYEFTMQGTCKSPCDSLPAQPDVERLGTTTGPAGTAHPVQLYGSGLTLGTRIRLRNDATSGETWMNQVVSVAPDGTSMKVLLGTRDLPPGRYDLQVGDGGYTSGTRSPGYLPNAFTVTEAPAAAAPGRFVPVAPKRFLDTRYGTGAPKAKVGAGGTVKLKVGGVNGVPATGVTAVVMNVTAVAPTGTGFLTVYPDGRPVPSASSLNYTAGRTLSNLVTVAVRNGTVNLRNSTGAVDVVADVAGYYTTAEGAGSALTSIDPTRFLDTRSGTGAPKARVGAGGSVKLKVAGVNGVPATGVTAVVMNVTAVAPTATGFVTVYPDGQAVPTASNINYSAGETLPNLVVVPVVNGSVVLRNSAGAVDLLADVTGYFTATGAGFTAAEPVRLLDTRSGLGARAGAVGPGGVVSMRVSGVAGVPSEGVTAVVLNVTAAAPTSGSFLTVHPHGRPRPAVSNLNYPAGRTISNLVVVPVVDGRITFTNHSGGVQVIADLNGWYSG
ncbi:hypothetical protein [Streptomyces showdoensis]|uniref:hypothetical protein n=1 Tax=Streptomyces showdoensis TaxID=68268 RepID=UPI000F5038A4|nr:hypothetical protein [Streptomyces showdoensis]